MPHLAGSMHSHMHVQTACIMGFPPIACGARGMISTLLKCKQKFAPEAMSLLPGTGRALFLGAGERDDLQGHL